MSVDLLGVGPAQAVACAVDGDEAAALDELVGARAAGLDRQDPVGGTVQDQHRDVDLRQVVPEVVTVIRGGDFATAASLIAEADVVSEATGIRYPPFAVLWLTCLSGNETEAAPLIEATVAEGTAAGQGHAVSFAQCMAAILCNGLGRYTAAQAAAVCKPATTPFMSPCGRCPT